MTTRLTDTKHNHNYQNYHKNNHQDMRLKKIQIDDLKKLIAEKRVMYDHNVDQKKYKWSGNASLKKIEMSLLPEYIRLNLKNYEDWLD